jgi:hypothetical protein
VIMLGFFPRLTLRLHRQIVALALLPGTAFSMRLSVIYWVFLPALSLNLGWRLSEIWPHGPQMRFVTELRTRIVLRANTHTS